MRSYFLKLFCLSSLTISSVSFSAIITVPGVSGIVFDDAVPSVSLSGTFDVSGITLVVDNMYLQYSSGVFSIYGDGAAEIGSHYILIELGTSSSPGFVVTNGAVTEVSLGITADFELESLSFSPNSLTFELDIANDIFEIYGGATIDLDGNPIVVDLGDNTSPGIEIDQGTLTQINMAITSSFTIHGLDIEANPLGMEWNGSFFILYGDVILSIDGQSIDADFGTVTDPGLEFIGGAISTFEITINADFTMGTLEVEVQDATIGMAGSLFYLGGTFIVTEVWSAELEISQVAGDGLEIDAGVSPNSFKMDDFAIEIDNVGIGTIDINELRISFLNNTIDEVIAKVQFAMDWEVDADISFIGNPATLDAIDISWEAADIESAIPLGETGVEIIKIEGGLYNLTNQNITLTQDFRVYDDGSSYTTLPISTYTDDIYFSGTVAQVFGGPFSLNGESVALLYNTTTAIITSSSTVLTSDFMLGAYESGGTWNSILGEGDLSLYLLWDDYYLVSSYFKIPSDPLVKGDLYAKITASGNLGAKMDVTFYVPSSVPIVGGDKLGSVSGAVVYIADDLGSSEAAGWTSYWWWGTHYFGAKYEFESGDISIIGSSGIDDIKSDVSSVKANIGWVKEVKSFILPEKQTSMLVTLNFGEIADTAYISVIGPDGYYDLKRIDITDVADSLEPPEALLGNDFTTIFNDSMATFLIVNHFPSFSDEHHLQTALSPGSYDVLISYKQGSLINATSISVNHFYPNSFGTIEANEALDGSIDLDLSYWSHYPDSTMIHLYVNNLDSSYSGELFGVVEFGTVDTDGNGNLQVNYVPTNIPHGDSLTFYFTIVDSTNVPFYSETTEPLVYTAPLHGNVSMAVADTLNHSWKLYLDLNGNGYHDKDTLGVFEPSAITDANGNYYFDNLTSGGEYDLKIVIPRKYSLSISSPNPLPNTFTFVGTEEEFDFILELN